MPDALDSGGSFPSPSVDSPEWQIALLASATNPFENPRHWGQGYLDFGGNMLSTLQALRHFAQHLPSRNILFTFGM
jgi:hypothetical protein